MKTMLRNRKNIQHFSYAASSAVTLVTLVFFRCHCGASYQRRGGPSLFVRGRPLLVLTRGAFYLQCKAVPQQDPDLSGSLPGTIPLFFVDFTWALF